MKYNTASQTFHIVAFDQDGRVTGEATNISCTLSIDGGARSALDDTEPTEIGTTGEYVFDLTQAETNGHELSFVPVCSTEDVQVLGTPSNVIYTIDVPTAVENGAAVLAAATTTPIEANVVEVAGQTATATAEVDFDALTTINGSGSQLFTIETLVAGNPEAEVETWITSDEEGANVIAGSKVSSSLGLVEFWLDPGTDENPAVYYAWFAKTGFTFTNPTEFTVTAE